MSMNDFGNQNFDDRARQLRAAAEHKGPQAAREPSTAKRPVPDMDRLRERAFGHKSRWILCDAETGYPITQLKAEPLAVPYGPDKQTMAVTEAVTPGNAAIGFLEAAGLYLTLCCDGTDEPCTECLKLGERMNAERFEP